MIAGVMLFLLLVSAVTYAAAWFGDAGLRRLGRATRGVWLLAMAAPFALLGAPLLFSGSDGGASRSMGPGGVFDLAPLVVDPTATASSGPGITLGLGLLWGLSSLLVAVALHRMHARLVRDRGGWGSGVVRGRKVLLSARCGPAVAGVLRPAIVLPRWVVRLPPRELDFVLLHEEEHLRARDTLVQAVALGLVVLAPWNPFSWLHLRGLRTAMEIDCDRRVLRRAPQPEAYGGSLLTVAAQASGLSMGLAAFTEKRRSLETRIRAMTDARTPWTISLSVVLVLVAVVLGVQACYVDNPMLIVNEDNGDQEAVSTTGADEARSVVEVADPQEVSANPTFTPFTVAPSIVNREEVVAAMADAYPPLLREAGIGGTVRVWFFIDEKGVPEDTRIHESSGHEALDRAAIEVAEVFRFTPALNRSEEVPVWVQFPITFQVK